MGFDYKTYTGLGKQTLRGHKQNLVNTRTQKKGTVTQNRKTHTCYECPGVFSGGVGQQGPAPWSGALSVAVLAWDFLKEIVIILITSTLVWSQVKQQGGNTAPPINRKLD